MRALQMLDIKLDLSPTYRQAAIAAIRRRLAESHGSEFAEAFICEHQDAVTRAIVNFLCGRDVDSAQRILVLLQRSSHT